MEGSSRWLVFLVLISLLSLFFFPSTSYASSTWLKFFRKDAVLNTYLRAYAVANDKLWVGTYGDGVVVYDGANTKVFNSKNSNTNANRKDGLISDLVTCLAVDSLGNRVWIGTNEGVSTCNLDGTEWNRYTDQNGLPNNVVRDIAIDDKGKVWVGTPSGLACFDGTEWKTYNSSNGLYEDSVHSVTANNGMIWVATVGGSISRFDGTGWKVFMHY
ncbi:MAG: hypothetical protein HQM08_07335 [Candidatus Riflebacteria bacterium]|nr:hypothetical protein [Candidatus Riflebacteria bacterium]